MGIGQRIGFAFRAFFSLLSSGTLPPDVADAAHSSPDEASATSSDPARVATGVTTEGARTTHQAHPTATLTGSAAGAGTAADGAVQILALLQRDARLLDFLMEDLAGYPDAQVGAAVREVHASSRRTLAQYLELEPILDGTEDQAVTLPDVDPSEVKLVGRTAGAPPIRGMLRHRGWRAGRVQLPPLPPSGSSRQVVAPAEVEIP